MATADVLLAEAPSLGADVGTLPGGCQLVPGAQYEPYCGTWVKDKDASDSMAGVCTALGLGSLMQHAVKLIRGIEVSMLGSHVSVGVFSIISWFKLSEVYNVNGSETRNSRRDMRLGGMQGRLVGPSASTDGKVQLHMRWSGAFPGEAVDELSLPTPDVLHIDSTVWVQGAEPVRYRQVYHRAS